MPALPVGTAAGVWLVAIKKTGTLAAYPPGSTSCGPAADFTAHVAVTGHRLTIGTVPICPNSGVYTWTAAGKSLTLRATSDKSCQARSVLFSGVWKK